MSDDKLIFWKALHDYHVAMISVYLKYDNELQAENSRRMCLDLQVKMSEIIEKRKGEKK